MLDQSGHIYCNSSLCKGILVIHVVEENLYKLTYNNGYYCCYIPGYIISNATQQSDRKMDLGKLNWTPLLYKAFNKLKDFAVFASYMRNPDFHAYSIIL